MTTISVIGFDADDTLWQNEQFFRFTEKRFAEMLSDHADHGDVAARLLEAERKNLAFYGYGIKGFTLSMVETAVELTGGRIGGHEIGQIVEWGRTMLSSPVELLPGVEDVVAELGKEYPLLLITKGDLFDQESKLARSGLGGYFRHVEIVREKDATVYSTILGKHGIAPDNFLMVGNSVRSDGICLKKTNLIYLPLEASLPKATDKFPENTGFTHYNVNNWREAEQRAINRLIRQRDPAAHTLRDVTPAQLEAHRSALSEGQYRRARHVVSEIARVARAVETLERGDLAALGALMSESYRSARDDYGSSSPALDAMWAAATAQPGCYGARYSGGGEAGAVVALVEASAVSDFLMGAAAAYQHASGREGAFFPVEAVTAAGVWNSQ